MNVIRVTCILHPSFRSSVSSLSRKDITLINKPFNIINMLFLATHALTVSLFYILAQKDITGIINVSFKLVDTNFDFLSLLINYAAFILMDIESELLSLPWFHGAIYINSGAITFRVILPGWLTDHFLSNNIQTSVHQRSRFKVRL